MSKLGKGVRKRIVISLYLVFGVLALLMVRLGYIQFVKGEEYSQMAIEQQTRDRVITSKRGTIYDRNMKPLAVSASVETVTANPSVVKADGNPEETARLLADILEEDYQDIYKKLTKNSSYEYIKRKIESAQAEEIKKLMADGKLKGISLDEDSKRYYPYSNFASHVIGFVGTDNQGLAGIELMYDSYLKGTSGRVVSATNAIGRDMPYEYEKYYNSEDGLNVVLTIDEVVQHFTERNLETAIKDNDVKNGAAAIVMDIKTGGILAMATKPDYDLNAPFTVTNEADVEYLESLDPNSQEYKDSLAAARNKMWRNKAVVDSYEPGSTFKILTSAIALEEGAVTLNSTFNCNGSKKVAGETIRCWKAGGHGFQDLAKAIQNSCNPAFMDIGEKVGKDNYFKYTKAFGLRDTTGIDLPGETEGIFFSQSNYGVVENATTSFGQGFQVTPIQLISAISAVANDGKYMKPHIVKQLTDSSGKVVQKFDGEFVRQTVSKETSDQLCLLLEEAVRVGSGKNAYIQGYRIAGKTGTSEKQPRSAGKKIASMVAFAPADDPQVAVLVMLDEPEGGQYFGGVIAAPVVGNIMNDVLQYLGVERTLSSEEIENADIIVPDLVEKTKGEAVQKLSAEGFKANVVGDGDTVVKQVPKAGTRLQKGSTVLVYTTESEPQMVTVPSVNGQTVLQANSTIVSSGLNFKLSGAGRITEDAGPTAAVKQDPEAGSVVERGSVVYVEFRHLDVE